MKIQEVVDSITNEGVSLWSAPSYDLVIICDKTEYIVEKMVTDTESEKITVYIKAKEQPVETPVDTVTQS
jgi:hypothetical protein